MRRRNAAAASAKVRAAMGVILAVTTSMVIWIVLWAVGFGRTGDAFIVSVVPIALVAVCLRVVASHLARRQP